MNKEQPFIENTENNGKLEIVKSKDDLILSKIENIEIRNHPGNADTVRVIKYFLTKEQVESFVEVWNKSLEKGPCKYKPSYWITVNLKNDSSRMFTANSSNIKENNDWCKGSLEKEYFDIIWNKLDTL